MDTLIEKEFLAVLEDEKDIIMPKQNSKQANDARALAWTNVKLKLEGRTGKAFEVKKTTEEVEQHPDTTQIGWKRTCGSPAIKASPNDEIVEGILGKSDPNFVCVTGEQWRLG